ncbi:MAG: N-acetylmuramoyl-L-alanine amidase [Cyclobacteriaceae bacterium]
MKPLTLQKDAWLKVDEVVTHQLTPNTGGNFEAGQPDTLVIHFTGGRNPQSSANWLCNPKAKASAHMIIGKEGEVIQLADFTTITWHAGRSTWDGRSGLNRYSIGIELDNAGQLEARADGYYTWFGVKVPEAEVLHRTRRHHKTPGWWQTYTEAQIERVEQLLALLIETYGIQTIVGHEEISPGRKVDPGPAFPLEQLRLRLLAGDRSEQAEADHQEFKSQGIVTANRLNIRKQPNINSPIVADPLKKGTLVSIDQEQADWVKVRLETEGWVKKEYLRI